MKDQTVDWKAVEGVIEFGGITVFKVSRFDRALGMILDELSTTDEDLAIRTRDSFGGDAFIRSSLVKFGRTFRK